MADERQRAAAALADGRWDEARAGFAAAIAAGPAEAPAGAAFAGLADALWWLGDSRGSVAQRERAYAAYCKSADTEGAIDAAARLSVDHKACFGNDVVAGGWLARAERLLDDAPGDLGPLPGVVWLSRAFHTDDPGHAVELSERALALARDIGDMGLELVALGNLGRWLVEAGQVTDGMRLLDEAMAATLGGEGTSLDMVVFSSCNMLNACNQTADLQRATQWCRAADDFVNTYGCPYLYVECRFLYGSVLLSTGDWVQAEHELQTAVRASEHHPAFRAPALSRLAQLRVDQGRLAEAESLVAQAAHPIATAPAAAAIHLTRGMPDAACSVLRRWLGRYGDTHIDAAQLLGLLVEASLAAGEIAEATDVADRLAAQSSDRARAEAALASGRLSRSSGETTAAIGAFEDAVVRFDQVDLPLSTGQARVQLSAVLSERAGPGDVQVAITEARAAMAVFDRLGARPDADACAAWLRSLGVAGRSGPRDVGVLSRREQEVLALVGDGLSNAEIAERLFISRKTASHHVSSILAKLDLRNRAEAAAHASRLTA